MKKLLVALAVIVAVFVGAWLVVRNRLRAAIEQRCAAALDAECDVGGISLRLDGASATSVHVVAGPGTIDIDAIEADFAWTALLASKPQSVVVRVVHPQVRESIPVGKIALALKNMGKGQLADGTPSSLTLDRLTVSNGDVDVQMNLLASLRVKDIAADWSTHSPLGVSWSDAGLESPLLKAPGTGPCTIKASAGSHVADVDCPKVKTKIDLDRVQTLDDLAKVFLDAKKQ